MGTLDFGGLSKGCCLLEFEFDALVEFFEGSLAPSAFVLLVLVSAIGGP